MTGKFITIEGMDGCGKSTQIEKIHAYFVQNGYDVIVTREPGGTPISEIIRQIILEPSYSAMSEMTEVLLYIAARVQHLEEKILPSLREGKIVICDRFLDSNIAYQGYGRGLEIEKIQKMNQLAFGNILPDITFFLDLAPEAALQRKRVQTNHILDRMERENNSFHQRVYEGFQKICQDNPQRVKRIRANQVADKVTEEIISYLINLLE